MTTDLFVFIAGVMLASAVIVAVAIMFNDHDRMCSGCGKCHTCGEELKQNYWCSKCKKYRFYIAHGYLGDDHDPSQCYDPPQCYDDHRNTERTQQNS